jgi:hypothetical protein
MCNYVRAMNEDFGENTEVRSIDLSLNRSLEELISSYWEAQNAGLDYKKETHSAFYALENYLCDMGAL